MNKKLRKLKRTLEIETARMKLLCKLIEQQNRDSYYDSKSSEYGVNRKIH